jgi:hypothetical protein
MKALKRRSLQAVRVSVAVAWVCAAGAIGVGPAALAATESSATAVNGLSSTKERGVISIASDPALSDGRLLIKVVAFNRRPEPAGFGPANVSISTTAGKPVALILLEQLVQETQKAAGVRTRQASSTDHDPSNYSHPGIATAGVGGSGEPDVSGYSGANNPTSGVVSPHTRATSNARTMSDAELKARIDMLNAGILQPMTIAPAKAAGGQVVTEKLKFARKEARALHIVVQFNDEQHEFDFEVPR